MILYLYALAHTLDGMPVTGLTGVSGEAVQLVNIDGIVAACGSINRAPEIARDTLFAQDRLVRELHDRAAALLPMRFGSSVANEQQLRELVERRRLGLQEHLDLVRGRDQMTLRVLSARGAAGAAGARGAAGVRGAAGLSTVARRDDAGQAEVDAASAAGAGSAGSRGVGTRYLARRAEERVPPALRTLVERLQPLQRAMRIESHHYPELLATIYHLVDRGTADVYRLAVADAKLSERLTVRVSGPSPAYAFARLP